MKPANIVFWLLAISIILTGLVTIVALLKNVSMSDLSGFYSIMGIFMGLFGGGLLGAVFREGNNPPRRRR
ncbi:MAG: hypothetical protein PHC28_01320 [Flavobacterium sp.]|uniref:hypothetical protein n=1 Tax=Flavobacterium sp. TaxID=239 RepID=UPI0026138CF4|nr:hypothetical protein [Flavobacterium sp.]MDD5149107.1 hypothetical protein [Flavobacterium sp.]